MVKYIVASSKSVDIRPGETKKNCSQSLRFQLNDGLSLNVPFNIITGSTYRSSTNSTKKNTADVVKMAVRANGLAMGVCLDGCDVTAKPDHIEYFSNHVLNTIDVIARECERLQTLTEKKVKEIVHRRFKELMGLLQNECAQKGWNDNALASAVALFDGPDGKIHYIGFGVGDTMVALDDEKEGVKTIIAAVSEAERNEDGALVPTMPYQIGAFPASWDKKISQTIEIAHGVATPWQSIMFMTDGIHEQLACEKRTGTFTYTDMFGEEVTQGILRVSLAEGAIDQLKVSRNVDSIYQAVDCRTQQQFEELQMSQDDAHIGDDATIAEFEVPTQNTRNCLRYDDFYQAISESVLGKKPTVEQCQVLLAQFEQIDPDTLMHLIRKWRNALLSTDSSATQEKGFKLLSGLTGRRHQSSLKAIPEEAQAAVSTYVKLINDLGLQQSLSVTPKQ